MSRNLFTYQNNELLFAEAQLSSLAAVKNYHEPVLIYKSSLISERIQWVKSWSGLTQLHFAMKSNYHPQILKLFKDAGCGLDVVSLGEIKAGLEAGFKPTDFIFSGVGKTIPEIEFAIDQQIFQINVESPAELRRISEIAGRKNKSISVGLRVNPLIETPTHPYISTALKDSKFGIDLNDVPECLEIIKKNPLVVFKCLSFHIGSQILDPMVFKESVDKMKGYYLELKKQFSTLTRFDVGGGLGIDYKSHDLDLDFQRWNQLQSAYQDSFKDFDAQILSELGRFLVARAAVFVCQVQYIKNKNMLVLDLGMNNNLRPSLYQAHHHFYNLKKNSENVVNYALVGPICESSDVFHKSFPMYETHEMDLLVMADCGAYVKSMASQYNLKNIAAEVFI